MSTTLRQLPPPLTLPIRSSLSNFSVALLSPSLKSGREEDSPYSQVFPTMTLASPISRNFREQSFMNATGRRTSLISSPKPILDKTLMVYSAIHILEPKPINSITYGLIKIAHLESQLESEYGVALYEEYQYEADSKFPLNSNFSSRILSSPTNYNSTPGLISLPTTLSDPSLNSLSIASDIGMVGSASNFFLSPCLHKT